MRNQPQGATPCLLAFGLALLVTAACDEGAGRPLAGPSADAAQVGKGDQPAGDVVAGDAATDDAAQPDAGPPGAPTCPAPDAVTRALWVWTSEVVTDPGARDALLDFAEAEGICRLYVQSGAGPLVVEGNLTQAHPTALATFLDLSAARGIVVELLYGRATWALGDEHGIPIALAEQAAAFQAAHAGAPLAGVHFDIEPHGIHGATSAGTVYDWSDEAQRPDILGQWLDLVDALAAITAPTGLALSWDAAFWLDGADQTYNPLEHGGVAKPVSEHLIDRVDHVVLMAYRDSAFGVGVDAETSANGIYDLAASEVAYAASVGKRVRLGVEVGGCSTHDGELALDPDFLDVVTFCDEGRTFMEVELGKLMAAEDPHDGFGGLALHHYGALSDPAAMAP